MKCPGHSRGVRHGRRDSIDRGSARTGWSGHAGGSADDPACSSSSFGVNPGRLLYQTKSKVLGDAYNFVTRPGLVWHLVPGALLGKPKTV